MRKNCQKLLTFITVTLLNVQVLHAGTNIISDQLPAGKTLDDYELGARPDGSSSTAVRLVELATLPGAGQVQQIVARGDSLFVVLREGRVWEYDLTGNVAATPFIDLNLLRTDFSDGVYWAPSSGLRGFAFHPDFESNGLAYTIHEETPDGSLPDYGTTYLDKEYVLAEWDYSGAGSPAFRLLFRVRFEHSWHTAQQIGFSPTAVSGDDDYGLLYLCFGDNGVSSEGSPFIDRTVDSDPTDVGQDFGIIHSAIIRIDPMDPSGLTDGELTALDRKRSSNGNFSIPLSNPHVGASGYKEELFAKGFRNPLTLSFSPSGLPIVADVGEQTIEEINAVHAGENYGWPVREGTFIVPWCDQVDGSPLGADDSMRWMSVGDLDDPAITFYVRDKDQTNLRQETLARSGAYDDGFAYPTFQYTHEENDHNGTGSGLAAIVGGDYYEGYWSEELDGLYVFGSISTDQLFYGDIAALDDGSENAPIFELPLIDTAGESILLRTIIGSLRTNVRFGKDSYGNLYLASKTNSKLYRFQGSPKLLLGSVPSEIVDVEAEQYFEFSLDRPPLDATLSYSLQVTDDLSAEFVSVDAEDYMVEDADPLANGMERVRYRYLVPIDSESPRFFRITTE